jgi:hypothetical protein
LGVYPEVSLGDARERRRKRARRSLLGNDPGEVKKEPNGWLSSKAKTLLKRSPASGLNSANMNGRTLFRQKILQATGKAYFPQTRQRPIADITAPEILSMLRVVEKSGALDTAQRVMQMCGQIFMYAIATGRAERNPVPDLRGA